MLSAFVTRHVRFAVYVSSGLVCVFVLDLFVALNLYAAKNVTEPIYYYSSSGIARSLYLSVDRLHAS